MITERLDRRITILRGKRHGAFDRDQYYLEHARRARVARKLRCYVRDMRPVVLMVPRWSAAQAFLDDVAVDVMLGMPSVRCRTLSVRPLEGRTDHQTWNWLVHAIIEFCALSVPHTASQVVSRHGFRVVLAELFRQAEASGHRRCLMVHGLEYLHVDALHDVISVFEDHIHHRPRPVCFNLVLAGPPGMPHPELHGVERLVLGDFDQREAVEALAEHLGAEDHDTLRALARQVGGIPDILAALAVTELAELREAARDPRALWNALGLLGRDLRRAVDIVAADPWLSARLETLVRPGLHRHDPERDPALVEAGLLRLVGPPMPRNEAAGVRIAPWAGKRKAELRTPLFGGLISGAAF